ncbi:rod shape-determining protein RodA [Anaeromyxobacter oryzae]|uniref:Peptidoglycan glycosyltransferase RodA n=1 Tax=Anaeromyxobacter oryzae TaxID=2918170 RepID=A0ABN6MN35_9BACT|nr:rod shape-determining protein RodA [Anaeromyxobacter oryzae]BDG01756.1 rod shape-determining protein RodA [Anaeromyxobacter oryzae]
MAPDVSLAATPHRRLFAHFPWHVAFLVLAISAIGIWNLASASRSAHAPVWISQSSWMGAGIVVALAVTLVDHRAFHRLAWVFYAIVVVLLLLVMVKGRYVMGARRWLTFGPVNFQPSELAKLSVALAMASWFAADSEKRKDGYGLFGIVIPLGITFLPAALILKQPDLGTALIVLAVGITQILFAKVKWKTLALLAGVGVVGAVLVYPHLKPYQKKRVETFMNPQADALGAGYHATQSMIAVGSGQALGKGWAQGTQTYLSFLPEQHTDFIFSVWAEEHGFVGCLLLIALYFALVTSAVDIAGNARDRFGHFLAVGLTGMLFWQVFINIGMVIGVLPVVGVTLPLMSYGGSSVLVIYTAIGLLANVGMRRFVN